MIVILLLVAVSMGYTTNMTVRCSNGDLSMRVMLKL
jgi:hypothetical protein